MSDETQIIYFDQEDAEIDGLGWNIIGTVDDAIALRFSKLSEAQLWCIGNGYKYIVEKR